MCLDIGNIKLSVRPILYFTVPDRGYWKQRLVLVQRPTVHRVQVDGSLAVDQGPEGLSSGRKNVRFLITLLVGIPRPGVQLRLLPFLVAIVKKSSKQTGIEVVQNRGQEIFVELKCVGELLRNLE